MKQISRVVMSLVLASLLLGVALGAMAWTGPAVAVTPTENGNGGGGVVISPTAQTKTADPGQIITYTHVITSNEAGNYTVTVGDSDPTFTVRLIHPDPNNPILIFDESGSQVISLTVEVSPQAVGGMQHTAQVTVTSQTDNAIEAVASNHTIVKNVQIEPGTARFADPGETITYTHTITNTGDSADIFTVTFLWSDPDFVTTLVYPDPDTPTISLDPFATGTIILTVGVPPTATAGITHTVQVTVTSQAIPTVTATAVNTTTVNYVGNVEIAPIQQAQNRFPGETAVFNHTVTNLGNGADIFVITSTETLPTFTASVEPESLSLDPNESETITVTVTVANTALSGDWVGIVVTATSQTDPMVTAVATDTVTVNAVYGVQIEPGGAQSADPGQTAVYTHLITNTGNITDIFTMSLSVSEPPFATTLESADASFVLYPVPNDPGVYTFTLGAYLTGTIALTVQVPLTATGGVTHTAQVTVTSQTIPTVTATAVNTTTVNQVAALSVTPNPPATQQVFPGDWVTYTHTITNLGNGPDIFNIEVANSESGFTSSDPNPLPLSPGVSGTITVTVQVPDTIPAVISNTTYVTVTSQHDSGKRGTATNTTTVQTVGVELGPDQARTVSPGSSIVYTLALTNSGSLSDTFTLTVTGNVFLTQLSQLTLKVPAQETAVISITVTAPRQIASGKEDVATISATSANRPSVSDSATLTTTVGQHNLFLPVVQVPGEWQRVGTNWLADRRAYSVAVCPTDNTIVYAGTSDALYRLNSNQWQKVTIGGLPTSDLALSVVLSPDNCDTVYVGFEDRGVWRSDDDGANWERVGGPSGISRVEKLVVLQGDRLFALGAYQIHYWNGTAWVNATANGSVFGSADRPVSNIYAFSPEGPLYAVQWFEGSIWRNPNPLSNPRDGWSLFPNLLQTGDIAMRSVAGDATGPRFIGTVNNHYAKQGNSWTRVQPFGARAFALDGPIGFAGYTGGKGVYLSYDDRTFTPLNNGWETPPTTVYTLLINQRDLYAGAVNGVWVYRNYP